MVTSQEGSFQQLDWFSVHLGEARGDRDELRSLEKSWRRLRSFWTFGASDEGFSHVLLRLFSHVQVQFEASPTAATQCLCLSSPCLSICTWFHSVLIVWPPLLRPQSFFFVFLFENRMKEEEKKKAFGLDCSDSLLQPPLFFLFSFSLSLSLAPISFSSVKPSHRLRARVRRP